MLIDFCSEFSSKDIKKTVLVRSVSQNVLFEEKVGLIVYLWLSGLSHITGCKLSNVSSNTAVFIFRGNTRPQSNTEIGREIKSLSYKVSPYLHPSPSINVTPDHSLNIYNSTVLDRHSVYRAETTTYFATISDQSINYKYLQILMVTYKQFWEHEGASWDMVGDPPFKLYDLSFK